MKILLSLLILIICMPVQARFYFQYGVNYDKATDTTTDYEVKTSRIFHKIFLGASLNNAQTLFLGQNINSWSYSEQEGSNAETTYSLTELGPKLVWFMGEAQNWYISFDWNPYAKGTRNKNDTERDIRGSSMGAALGYRFRLTKQIGLGASINYHKLSMSSETEDTTESSISDTFSNMMPMLELSFMSK